jgi:hypothetical protein
MVIPNSQAAQAAQARETPVPVELLQPLPKPSAASKGKRPVRGPILEAPLGSNKLVGRPSASGLPGGGSEPSNSSLNNLDYPSPSKEESPTLTRR